MREGILWAFTGLLVLLTLLPISRRTVWWVRGADFPRAQLALMGAGLAVLALWLLDRTEWSTWGLIAAALLAVVYQCVWITPYTRLFPREVKDAEAVNAGGGVAAARGDRLRLLSANVLMTNWRVGDFLRIVRDARPDVVVTLETNAWWEQGMRELEASYPHRLSCPLENLYGMHLYSRFPLEDAKTQFLVEEDKPSMHMLLVLPSGRRVALHCLHPAPPSPTENPTSRERDAELVMVGRSVATARFPVIVSGDLNDVAWSATTRLFRKLSGLLDPRVGRGMYNTFHARYGVCRWPVDHFFHSAHFTLVKLERLPYYGSDHFPVLIELECEAGEVPGQQSPEADDEDLAEAREKMAKEQVSSVEVHRPGEGRRGGVAAR
jgi:endonuclease/exonuclease/phosphatase (EEP) superfamily protein YafD